MPKSEIEVLIEKATNENNINEDWSLFMEVIDQINYNNAEKEAIRIFVRKLNDRDPHVSDHTISLLNACVNNCNRSFKLEVCSRYFVDELKNFITRTRHPKLSQRMASVIEKWSNESDFRNDPALNLIPTLYIELKRNGVEFAQEPPTMKTSSINLDAKKEEEDLAKAIKLSLKEAASANQKSSSSSSSSSTSLYATLLPKAAANIEKIKEKRKVKALYDFEAAEENEISFKAGDILFVTDDSDQNWWKGQTPKGSEGLFPSNFVTSDLAAEIETFEVSNSGKKVTFDEKKNVKIVINENRMLPVIDERKIDECIELLQNADPTGEIQPDTQEMLELEDDCYMMGPLIDKKLQHIDQKHAVLEDLNIKILEAFQIYNNLMKESLSKQATFMTQPPSMMNPSNFGYSSIPYVASGAQPLTDPNGMMLANQMNMAQPPYGFVPNAQPSGYFPTSNIPTEMINPAMNSMLPNAQTNPQMFINNPNQMPPMNASLTQNQPHFVDTNTNTVYQAPTARYQ